MAIFTSRHVLAIKINWHRPTTCEQFDFLFGDRMWNEICRLISKSSHLPPCVAWKYLFSFHVLNYVAVAVIWSQPVTGSFFSRDLVIRRRSTAFRSPGSPRIQNCHCSSNLTQFPTFPPFFAVTEIRVIWVYTDSTFEWFAHSVGGEISVGPIPPPRSVGLNAQISFN